MPEPQMKVLYLSHEMFDKIKATIETTYPNAAVTRYPDELQSEPELEAFFLCPRSMDRTPYPCPCHEVWGGGAHPGERCTCNGGTGTSDL